MCRENQPDFVFLSETKAKEEDIGRLSRRLNFAKKEVVQANGTVGGLALLWVDTFKLSVISKDRWFIHYLA